MGVNPDRPQHVSRSGSATPFDRWRLASAVIGALLLPVFALALFRAIGSASASMPAVGALLAASTMLSLGFPRPAWAGFVRITLAVALLQWLVIAAVAGAIPVASTAGIATLAACTIIAALALGPELGAKPNAFAILAVAAAAGTSLLVGIGWWSGTAVIVQAATAFVPMQFNTALTMFCLAVSFWLSLHRHRRSGMILLIPVFVFTLATLLEEFAGATLDVGRWLMPHPIVAEHVQPGRMAPNTAIGALLIAFGIVVLPLDRKQHLSRAAMTWLCGFAASVIASFVLTGYLLELPMMRSWGSTTPMALLTAVSLLLLGLALATLRLESAPRARGSMPWTPVLMGLAGAMLVLTVWLSAHKSTELDARQELARLLDIAVETSAERAVERANTIRRAARRAANASSAEERLRIFQNDARGYLDDFPTLRSMALVGPDGRVVDVQSRSPELGECLSRLAEGIAKGAAAAIVACGNDGMLLSSSLAGDGTHRHGVAGLFELTPILNQQIAILDRAIPVRIELGDQTLLSRGLADGQPITRPILLDHSLTAQIEAHVHGSAGDSQGILSAFLLIGTVACALLAVSIRLAALARERAETAERRQSELEDQSEAMLRLQTNLLRAQEIAGLGHWAYEPARDRLEWSDALNHVFDLTAVQLPTSIGDIAALIHPDDRERWQSAHEAALAGERDLELDFRHTGADGRVRHLHERARLLRRSDGSPWLLAATVQDISDRERMTQAMAQSEERFRLIARATADALWDWDIDARSVWYSDGMDKLFGIPGGYHGSDITSWSERVHPGDRQRVVASIDAAVTGVIDAWESEYRYLGRDGRCLHVHDRGFVLRDRSGRAVRMVGGMSDVTSQREMQQRQERINRALRLLSACSDAVFAADDESWLLNEVCRRALADGRYELAWIGFALDDLSQTIRPMAVQGRAQALVLDATTEFQWSGADHGALGAPGRAIHGAVPVVVRDLAQGGDDWSTRALASGLYSAICLPLQNRERVFGVLVLYGSEPIVSAPPELSILQDLADNLSRGIAALRLNQEQDRLHQAIAQVAASAYEAHDDAFFGNLLDKLVHALEARGALLFRYLDARDESVSLIAGTCDGVSLPAATYVQSTLPFYDLRGQPQFACIWPEHDTRSSSVFSGGVGLMLYGLRLDDSDGRPVGALCLLHDHLRANRFMWTTMRVFAARTAAEMKRVEHEKFIREQSMLLDQAIEAIFVCDLQGRVRYWNEGATRLFGRSSRDMIGKPLAEIAEIGTGQVDQVLLELQAKTDLREEIRLHAADGDIVNIEAHWSLARTGPESEPALLCIAIDVSERQRMLDRLQDHESRLSAIFDTAAEGIITIDDRGRIESMNPHALAIFGYGLDELVGQNVAQLMPEPLASEHDMFIARYLETGKMALPSTGRELIGRRRDGSLFPVELSVRDVKLASGRLFTGFIRDITARRQAEAAMQALLQDLDAQNQGLQEFVYVASHDLQEPLRKIRVFTDRVLQSQGDQLNDQSRDFLGRAIAAAQRMQTLINDLLSYSQVTSKAAVFATVDLAGVIAAVTDDLALRLDSSSGKVVVGPLPTIEGDPTQLRQLFQNLIGNSLKYRAPNRAPVVRIDASETRLLGQPAWCIRVEDNGIGFDMRHANKIFAPFQRLHARDEFEGSGIGLAIVKRIVNRHGGLVFAEGQPGVGSVFKITLPSNPRARPGGPQARQRSIAMEHIDEATSEDATPHSDRRR